MDDGFDFGRSNLELGPLPSLHLPLPQLRFPFHARSPNRATNNLLQKTRVDFIRLRDSRSGLHATLGKTFLTYSSLALRSPPILSAKPG